MENAPQRSWLRDRYEPRKRLADRAASEIWQAWDTLLDRPVILKILGGRDSELWLHEARAAVTVRHPHIAVLYDADVLPDGRPWLAFEQVAGRTVDDLIESVPLSWPDAVRIVSRVADGLGALHGAGLLHGDVSPANIVVDEGGEPKILDFGLATQNFVGMIDSYSSRAGTVGSMAPERIQNRAADPRSDLFGLGTVLFQLLTGEEPFPGPSQVERLRSALDEEPRWPGVEVPIALRTLTRSLLAKDPEHRPQSAEAVAISLKRIGASLSETDALGPPRAFAFRGLAPFLEADREMFFGRDEERGHLLSRVSQEALLVLYGPSGCGKTSLLRAGLLPALRREGLSAVYMRPFQDPRGSLIEACKRRLGIAPLDQEALPDYLQRLGEQLDSEIVIIVDQAEELFVQVRDSASRESFLDILGACVVGSSTRVVLALRSDFLYLLAEALEPCISDPLASRRLFRLHPLALNQVLRILSRSLAGSSLGADDQLVQKLAKDLVGEGKSVLASELQIVGEQLEKRCVGTLEAYQRLGGKEGLISSYLESVVSDSPLPKETRLLLHSLISEDGTRAIMDLKNVTVRAQISEPEASMILAHLVDARLVREVQDRDPWCYELQHESLISDIERLVSSDLNARQKADLLLKQYMAQAGYEPNTRIPLGVVRRIYRDGSPVRSPEGENLIARSRRRGWAQVFLWGAILAMIITTGLAWISVEHRWVGRKLQDGHEGSVRAIALANEGRHLVSAGEDGKLLVWDFETRLIEHVISGPPKTFPTKLKISHSGEWLAIGYDDGKAEIRDTIYWKIQQRFPPVARGSGGFLFLPDDRVLMTNHGRSRIGDIGTGNVSMHIPYGNQDSQLYAFPETTQVMLDSLIWDWAHERPLTERDLRFALHGIDGYSPSKRVVTADKWGWVTFWKIETSSHPEVASRLHEISRHLVHKDIGRSVAISSRGEWAVTAADDLVLWDMKQERLVGRLEYPSIVWDTIFTPDDKHIVSGHGDGTIHVWGRACRCRIASFNGHSAPVRAVAFSNDGSALVSGGEDASLIVWDTSTGHKKHIIEGFGYRVNALAFSADDSLLLVAELPGQDGFRSWIDRESGYKIQVLPESPYALGLSSNGRWAIGIKGLYDLHTGELVTKSQKGRHFLGGGVYGAQFLPKGDSAITISCTGIVSRLRGMPWRVVALQRFHNRTFVCLALSPNAEWFAIGDDSGSIDLWDTESLFEIGSVGRHNGRVKALAAHPNNRWLASVGDDHRVLLWDVPRRKLLAEIGTHSAPTLSVDFSPDGKQLAVGGHDGSVRIYTVERWLWNMKIDSDN